MEPFDKYAYYRRSVQDPVHEVDFFNEVYEELRPGQVPVILREDFCGTFANCCEWIRRDEARRAYGVDLDPEPLEYGKSHEFQTLSPKQQDQLLILQKDVLSPDLPSADVICALNFSYFIFKERAKLKSYFQNALATLNTQGILVLDCFGGSQCQEANEDETEYEDEGYSYFWDQDSFDPVTYNGQFYIHFQRQGEKKRKNVFSYDWRMWTIPEIRDLLLEVGFKKVHVYWEGTDEEGEGDGDFTRTASAEACESWVAYIVGEA